MLSKCPLIELVEPQLTPLGVIKNLGGLVNQLSYRVFQLKGKVNSLKNSNFYVISYIGKLNDRVNSLRSNNVKIRDIIQEL